VPGLSGVVDKVKAGGAQRGWALVRFEGIHERQWLRPSQMCHLQVDDSCTDNAKFVSGVDVEVVRVFRSNNKVRAELTVGSFGVIEKIQEEGATIGWALLRLNGIPECQWVPPSKFCHLKLVNVCCGVEDSLLRSKDCSLAKFGLESISERNGDNSQCSEDETGQFSDSEQTRHSDSDGHAGRDTDVFSP